LAGQRITGGTKVGFDGVDYEGGNVGVFRLGRGDEPPVKLAGQQDFDLVFAV